MIRHKQHTSWKLFVPVAIGMFLGIGATFGTLLITQPTSVHQNGATSDESGQSLSVNDGPLTDDTNATNKADLRSVLHRIEAAETEQHRFDRLATIYTFVSGLSSEDVHELLSQSGNSQWKVSRKTRTELQTVLLERLTMTKPLKAVEFVLDHSPSRPDLTPSLVSIFLDWAISDLDEAVATAKQIPEANRKLALQGILQTITDYPFEQRRELATELNLEAYFIESYLKSLDLEKLKTPDQVWYSVIDVAQQDYQCFPKLLEIAQLWYANSGFEALDQIRTTFGEGEIKKMFVVTVLQHIAEVDPELAFEYVFDKLSGDTQLDAANQVVGVWASQDPSRALEAVAGLEPSGILEQLQSTVVNQWAVQDPVYVLENLSEFPRHTQIPGAVAAIGALTSHSPERAVARLLQIEDADMRIQAAHALVSIWSENDLEAAHNWVLEEPAIRNIREHLYEPIIYSLVATNPSRALELARKHPLSGGQVGFEAYILREIAVHDIQVALELLANVRAGHKNFAYGAVGSAHVLKGDFQKAIDLGLELGESAHSNYFQYISYIWVNTDPDRLYEMLPEFPNKEARSKAAYALCVLNTNNDYLTTQQVKVLDQYLTAKDREILGPLAPPDTP